MPRRAARVQDSCSQKAVFLLLLLGTSQPLQPVPRNQAACQRSVSPTAGLQCPVQRAPSPQRTRTILESWTPWPLLPGLAHAGNDGTLWTARSSSDSGCSPPPPPVLEHPDFPCPAPTEFPTHRPGRRRRRRPPAETRGSAGAREAGDSSITSARRRSQSAAGPRPGRESGQEPPATLRGAGAGRPLRASSAEGAACAAGGPPARALGAPAEAALSRRPALSLTASSGHGISVETFKTTLVPLLSLTAMTLTLAS